MRARSDLPSRLIRRTALKEQLKRFFEELFEGFPDMRVTVHEPVIGEDLAAWRGVIEATHLGEFMGIPATGKRVTIKEYHIERMRDGLMVEHWGLFAKLSLLQQLGALSTSAPAE